MTYRHPQKRWQPSGTHSGEWHTTSACPTYNNVSHYNKSAARPYTAFPTIGARYEARRGSKTSYANYGNCPSGDCKASAVSRSLQKTPQETETAADKNLSSSSSDTSASTDNTSEEFVAAHVGTKSKWSTEKGERTDAPVATPSVSTKRAPGAANKTSWAVWDWDDECEGEKEAPHKDTSWSAWNWDEYEGDAHKNKAMWDWSEADDGDGKLAEWEDYMEYRAAKNWDKEKEKGTSERPWRDEWPHVGGKGGRRASVPHGDERGGKVFRAKSLVQKEESPKKSTGAHYPRFATYLRISNVKNTFVHFYEKTYNTKKSIDDTSIVYQTYTRELVTPQNVEKSFSRRDNGDEGPETLMICNIPCRFTQPEVMSMMDSKGFSGQYNFFYLPMDGKRSSKPQAVKKWSNLGYAFVNFKCPKDALRFEKTFNGFCFVGYDGTLSKKVCKVAPARMQGFYENLRCYQRRISGEEAARNSPFISVPLEKFDMNASEFIDWIFSPTDVAQFLPASKELSWNNDIISCDQIQPHDVADDEQSAVVPKIMPLALYSEDHHLAIEHAPNGHAHSVDDGRKGHNHGVDTDALQPHGVDNHNGEKLCADDDKGEKHWVDNQVGRNHWVNYNDGKAHSVDYHNDKDCIVDNHDRRHACGDNHEGQNLSGNKRADKKSGADKRDDKKSGVTAQGGM